MKNKKNGKSTPIQKQIAESAYYKWIERGLPPEGAEKDWLEAEEEVFDSLKETRG